MASCDTVSGVYSRTARRLRKNLSKSAFIRGLRITATTTSWGTSLAISLGLTPSTVWIQTEQIGAVPLAGGIIGGLHSSHAEILGSSGAWRSGKGEGCRNTTIQQASLL